MQAGHRLARMIRQHAQARQAEVAQDLAADAELAAVHRLRARADAFGAREVGRVHIVGGTADLLEPREEVLARTLWAQVDDRTAAFAADRAHRGAQVVARRRAARGVRDAEDVAEQVAAVHADKHGIADLGHHAVRIG